MDNKTIEKYRKNKLSEEELSEFISQVKSDGDDNVSSAIDKDLNDFNPNREAEDDVLERKVNDYLTLALFSKRTYKPLWIKIAFVAASILLPVLIFGNIYFYNKSHSCQEPVPMLVATTDKHITKVDFPDGSSAEINACSNLKYSSKDFQGDSACIAFDGEGLFHIAKKTNRRFLINSENIKVTVHGTTFNLQAYSDAESAKLSLIDGAVAMTSKKSGKTVNIKPMEEATVNYNTGEISIKKIEDIGNITAWTTCKLKFNDAPMDKVILKIEEIYNCNLTINKNLCGENYTGVIPTDNILLAVSILEKIYDVHITVSEK